MPASESNQAKLRRRRWLLITGAAILLVVAAAVWRIGGRSAISTDAPDEQPPRSYEVVYNVRELGQVRQERVVVRRPYESRRSSTRAGQRVSGTLVNARGLWQYVNEPSPGWELIDPGRRRAEADARPLGALDLLLEAGLAELRPEGTVLGRSCTSFRVREPIGSVASEEPTPRDYVELCVDRTGVVLREEWVSKGRLLRQVQANRFDPAPSLGADTFLPAPRVDDEARQTLAGRRELPFTDEIEKSLDVGFDVPERIEVEGGIAVLNLDPFGQPVGGRATRFFRSHSDLVDVEEVESESVDTDRGLPHDVPIGEGFVETDLRTVILKVVLPRGITVVMRGPNLELLDTMAAAMKLRR